MIYNYDFCSDFLSYIKKNLILEQKDEISLKNYLIVSGNKLITISNQDYIELVGRSSFYSKCEWVGFKKELMYESTIKSREVLSSIHDTELAYFDSKSILKSKEELSFLRHLQLTQYRMEGLMKEMKILEVGVDLVVINVQSEVYFTKLLIFLEKLIFKYNF